MKQLLFIVALFFISLTAFSQAEGMHSRNPEMKKRMEEMKAEKVAFLTERLNLVPAVAEKFFPLYNEFSEKRMVLGRNKGRFYHIYRHMETKTPAEFETMADELVNVQEQESNLAKDYHVKFKKVLTSEQLFKLYIAEEEFHKRLLKRIADYKRQKKDVEQTNGESKEAPISPREEK